MAVTTIGSLPLGQSCAITAALTASGVTNYSTFSVQASPDGHDHTLVLTAADATTLPTTLTVDLEVSPDGGTTWGKYSTAIALVATAALTAKVVLNVVSGLLYRINPTTYTAGSGTGTTVYGCAN